jgi:ribosomal protein L13
VVTAAFAPGKLKITGKETADIVVEVVLSTNKSFEWKEVVQDNKWEPGKDEQVVDMGIRGMIPKIR